VVERWHTRSAVYRRF